MLFIAALCDKSVPKFDNGRLPSLPWTHRRSCSGSRGDLPCDDSCSCFLSRSLSHPRRARGRPGRLSGAATVLVRPRPSVCGRTASRPRYRRSHRGDRGGACRGSRDLRGDGADERQYRLGRNSGRVRRDAHPPRVDHRSEGRDSRRRRRRRDNRTERRPRGGRTVFPSGHPARRRRAGLRRPGGLPSGAGALARRAAGSTGSRRPCSSRCEYSRDNRCASRAARSGRAVARPGSGGRGGAHSRSGSRCRHPGRCRGLSGSCPNSASGFSRREPARRIQTSEKGRDRAHVPGRREPSERCRACAPPEQRRARSDYRVGTPDAASRSRRCRTSQARLARGGSWNCLPRPRACARRDLAAHGRDGGGRTARTGDLVSALGRAQRAPRASARLGPGGIWRPRTRCCPRSRTAAQRLDPNACSYHGRRCVTT